MKKMFEICSEFARSSMGAVHCPISLIALSRLRLYAEFKHFIQFSLQLLDKGS